MVGVNFDKIWSEPEKVWFGVHSLAVSELLENDPEPTLPAAMVAGRDRRICAWRGPRKQTSLPSTIWSDTALVSSSRPRIVASDHRWGM